MYQMRRDAELARMRSDFVSSVSHELRTPLTQVQLFLETLRLGRHRTDAQREWIFENMQREVTRLTALVDNVLHFSRAERGVGGGAREATRLDQYLQAAIADFAPLASVRGVAIATRFEPGIITQLHRESFRQVILNLLDNAVKYGPKGQTVLVSTDIVDGRIRICVDDEGPGVEPRERETIFEPFRRGAQAVGGVAVGSGIGLSVVRELVEWHDGTVHVESGARGGARFVLALPGWREPTDTPELAAISHAGPQ
jgi:signal transduction histidine kinase